MDKRNKGIYQKFTVSRNDGRDLPGFKHEGCEYFVLDITHDPFALPALKAYSEACSAEYPVLSSELKELVSTRRSKGSAEQQTANIDYTAAINDLYGLHSSVSLADLPYGASWLDRIERIINHLNAAKAQHCA